MSTSAGVRSALTLPIPILFSKGRQPFEVNLSTPSALHGATVIATATAIVIVMITDRLDHQEAPPRFARIPTHF
jgi:hypothetical protein